MSRAIYVFYAPSLPLIIILIEINCGSNSEYMHACKCELLYKNITQKVKVRIAAAPCNFIKNRWNSCVG